MTAPAYIFVGDQGQVLASIDEPAAEELAYAAVGMVIIIRVADWHFYGTGETWIPIASGKLDRSELDGEVTPPWHVAAPDFEPPAAISGGIADAFVESISTSPKGGAKPDDVR